MPVTEQAVGELRSWCSRRSEAAAPGPGTRPPPARGARAAHPRTERCGRAAQGPFSPVSHSTICPLEDQVTGFQASVPHPPCLPSRGGGSPETPAGPSRGGRALFSGVPAGTLLTAPCGALPWAAARARARAPTPSRRLGVGPMARGRLAFGLEQGQACLGRLRPRLPSVDWPRGRLGGARPMPRA